MKTIKQLITECKAGASARRAQFINTGVYRNAKASAKAGGTYGEQPVTPAGFHTVITNAGEFRHIPDNYSTPAPKAAEAPKAAPVYSTPAPKPARRVVAPANGRPEQLTLTLF